MMLEELERSNNWVVVVEERFLWGIFKQSCTGGEGEGGGEGSILTMKLTSCILKEAGRRSVAASAGRLRYDPNLF